MARPYKKGIDYAGWSVDMFENEPKIDKLLDAQGWTGFGIYFYLCQRAFGSEGYYYKWGFADGASTARKMGCGIGSGTVKETVDCCLRIGLFNQGLFDRWEILTSRAIEKSYWAVASNRRDKTVIKEFWLLSEEESPGIVLIPYNSVMEGHNSVMEGHNSVMEGHNDTVVKYSKVKDSKVKESKARESARARAYYPEDEKLNQAFEDYVRMRKEIKHPMTDKAITLAMSKLEKLATRDGEFDHDVAIEILNQSVMNSWNGLFELKQKKTAFDDWRNA